MTPASSRSTRALAAVVALAGALAGVSGCATSRGTGAAAAPGAAEQDTWARLLQMADERRLDTAVVRTALRSTSTPLRAAAARAVGQVHGQAMAGDLRRLLADRDTAVAANAAFALGLLRDTAATATLAGTLPAASPDVGVEVAWALGQIGGPAREAIVSALTGRPARDPRVIGALLLAASRLRPTPVSAAVPYLASADPQVRWRAVYVAARAYAPDGVRAVLPLAADSSALVRALVARELSKRAAGDSLGTRALVALAALARDPDAHVRIEAVRALGGYGDAARDAVVSALRDADANVRIAAAQTLAPVLDGERAPWMQAWRADTGFMFRRSVLVSALHDDVVLPAADLDDADSWVHQGDWRYRAAVADAGAGAPSIERMREVSLPLARDPDPRVRAAGYAAMAPWADSAGEHVWRRQFMYIGLKDFDPYVRTICIQALTSRATAAEVPLVLASWQIAERDTVSDARVAAVRFFESAWRRDSAAIGDSIAAVLRSLPAPRDPLARAAAEDVPLFAAWRDAPAPAPRPLS
ncbi:MAG TPA: HEAT repeat domain-containing protein, partial [Gemmatimonadaceae bacterium]|nr:HEAT repeat domain-containing protein [Gemmatimonadaceae bacterium]